jgi:hypothetical protein
MVHHKILLVLMITAGIVLLVQPIHAEEQVQQELIYQTAFSTDPHWITNSPRSFYWDPQKGIYHYSIEPSTGSYAYIEVDYDNGPFTLEYDVTPQRTDELATFRLGFSTKEMQRTQGTIALTEFANGKYGRLMWIRAVTPGNKLYEVSSQAFSYGGTTGAKTVNYLDNKTYHVTLQYDESRTMLTMRVVEKATGKEIWGYFLNTYESLRGMNRIFIGAVGDYSEMGPVAEGYIDNVKLSTQKIVTTTPAFVTTVQTTAPLKQTTRPTTKPTTMVPTQTPTPASPISPFIPLAASGIAVSVLYYSAIRKKQ